MSIRAWRRSRSALNCRIIEHTVGYFGVLKSWNQRIEAAAHDRHTAPATPPSGETRSPLGCSRKADETRRAA